MHAFFWKIPIIIIHAWIILIHAFLCFDVLLVASLINVCFVFCLFFVFLTVIFSNFLFRRESYVYIWRWKIVPFFCSDWMCKQKGYSLFFFFSSIFRICSFNCISRIYSFGFFVLFYSSYQQWSKQFKSISY